MFVGYGENIISLIGLNGFDQLSLRIPKMQLDTTGTLRIPEGDYSARGRDLPSSWFWPSNISMAACCCGYIRTREKHVE